MKKKATRHMNLRYLMGQNGYQQKDVARVLGKSVHYISSRMTGQEDWSLRDVYRIADLFEIEAADIPRFFPLDGKDNMPLFDSKGRRRELYAHD